MADLPPVGVAIPWGEADRTPVGMPEDESDEDDARSICLEYGMLDHEQDVQDEMGYFDGTNRFYILLGPPRPEFTPPCFSDIEGALDVFSSRPAFSLAPGESHTVDIGWGLVVPERHVVVFSPRDWMTRNGIVLTEKILGRGVHNNISLRLTNHDRSRRKIKPQNIIANMFTRRSHQSDFQFVTHSEYYGFDPDDPGHQ